MITVYTETPNTHNVTESIRVKFEDRVKYSGSSFEEILKIQQGSWEPQGWTEYQRELQKRLWVISGKLFICPTPESYYRVLEHLGLARIIVT